MAFDFLIIISKQKIVLSESTNYLMRNSRLGLDGSLFHHARDFSLKNYPLFVLEVTFLKITYLLKNMLVAPEVGTIENVFDCAQVQNLVADGNTNSRRWLQKMRENIS